jgi:hypothetical protein
MDGFSQSDWKSERGLTYFMADLFGRIAYVDRDPVSVCSPARGQRQLARSD